MNDSFYWFKWNMVKFDNGYSKHYVNWMNTLVDSWTHMLFSSFKAFVWKPVLIYSDSESIQIDKTFYSEDWNNRCYYWWRFIWSTKIACHPLSLKLLFVSFEAVKAVDNVWLKWKHNNHWDVFSSRWGAILTDQKLLENKSKLVLTAPLSLGK